VVGRSQKFQKIVVRRGLPPEKAAFRAVAFYVADGGD